MTATSSLFDQIVESAVARTLNDRSFNRDVAHDEHRGAIAQHHVARAEVLDEILEQLVEATAAELLGELREHGLLWSVVAEIVGVTDAAVRKWRRGEAIDTAHRRRLARLVALERLYDGYGDPAARFAEWLDTSVVGNFSATPLQLLALQRDIDSSALQPLLDWMLGHPDGDAGELILDRYLGSSWRDEARAEQRFRIVTNAAGERVLVIDE